MKRLRKLCFSGIVVALCFGLTDDARYQLIYEDSGAIAVKSGQELRDGIDVKVLQQPGSLLITYREIDN